MSMKACNQCVNYARGVGVFGNNCYRPTDEINPVTARPYGLGQKCYRERSKPFWPWSDRCGPDAQYFEQKPQETGEGKA